MSIDYSKAELLMTTIKLAADLGPGEANSIGALAVAELRAMEEEAKKELAVRAERAKKEAAMKAEADAKAKAEEAKVEEDEAPSGRRF